METQDFKLSTVQVNPQQKSAKGATGALSEKGSVKGKNVRLVQRVDESGKCAIF